MRIPLGKPFFGEEEEEAVSRVIRSGRPAMGDTVAEFEAALAKRFTRNYCVAVNSGTVALFLGLKVLGVKRVIIPVVTCDALLQAAASAGVAVTFCDVDSETQNLDLSTLPEEALRAADAVIVTHTYGHSADMDNIGFYREKHNLVLVEDFAQATGGYYRDKPAGSFGDISVTSFYAAKGLAAGHGGAIFTDDEETYRRCLYARGSRTGDQYSDLVPLNLQMTDIQASLGLVQLKKLEKSLELRRDIAAKYNTGLKNLPLGLPAVRDYAGHAYYKYAVVLPEQINKQHFIKEMAERGIETGKLYDPPLHKTAVAKTLFPDAPFLPVAEGLVGRVVSLPMYPGLSDAEIKAVCEAIAGILAGT